MNLENWKEQVVILSHVRNYPKTSHGFREAGLPRLTENLHLGYFRLCNPKYAEVK